MQEDLKLKASSGFLWSAIDIFGKQGIQVVINLIIARILIPSDFGLIGMLTIFWGIAQAFVDSGFGTALIQKKEPTQKDYSTVYIFNIITSVILYIIIYFCAPLIATFYNQPLLIPLTRFLGLNIIINSLSLVQANIFVKKINFKTTTKISLLSVSISGAIGIILAYNKFGVWSLAVQQILFATLTSGFLIISSKWKPSFIFSYSSFKHMFKFGSRLLASGILDIIFTNIYNLIIGKSFSAVQLGYYTQAQKIESFPVSFLGSSIGRVTFPIFSTLQDDNHKLKKSYRKVIKVIVFINFPIMIFLIASSESLIRVLLTEKWVSSVIFLQLLCVIGLTFPLSGINLNILNVKGRSDLFFKLEVLKKILIIISIVITLPFGIIPLLTGQVVFSFIAYFINIYYSGKLIGFSIKEQISDILPYLIISLIMGLIIYLFNMTLEEKHLVKLAAQFITGVVFYLASAYFLKLEALNETLNMLKIYKLKLNNMVTGNG